MFWFIAPFKRSFDEIGFIYKIPEKFLKEIKVWQIVKIPFWNAEIFWVIYEIFENPPKNFEKSKIREISQIQNEKSFINWYRIELLKFISENYFTAIHNSLNLFLPKNLIEKVKKGKLTQKEKAYKYFSLKNNNLTKKQEQLFLEIYNSKEKKILLFWVTGSWKTEIYIKLIQKYLSENKQVLFLIPEIILTNQIAQRLKNFFWEDLIVLNSTVSEAKKTQYFLDIESWNAKIIIWTRSAIFYPFSNLALIIIDESMTILIFLTSLLATILWKLQTKLQN